jgi:D-serine dehydratase
MEAASSYMLSLKRLREESLDHHTKGLPFGMRVSPAQVIDRGWNVKRGDLPFPLLVIKESALEHNLSEMAGWCARNNLLIAPHGKTTMCPQIFDRQIAHGAWAITVANVSQAQVCLGFDIKRILIANQVAGASNLHSLSTAINSDPEVDFYCLIDSLAGVDHLARGLERSGARRPLNVLIEWGRNGWRTGVRSEDQGIAVYNEAMRYPQSLRVCGFEAFEGLASSPEGTDAEARLVDEFLEGLKKLSMQLRSKWPGDERPLLSIGGSAFLDRVLHLAQQVSEEFRILVRSGCYITHDHGMYERKQSAALLRAGDQERIPQFIPALELWSYVQSIPEKRRAFLTFGKRDCPHDADLPIPLFALSAGDPMGSARSLGSARVSNLNDQHAYLDLSGDEKLEVGDLVCCGISHPCTAFDKWRVIPLVNDDYDVVDLYRTFF